MKKIIFEIVIVWSTILIIVWLTNSLQEPFQSFFNYFLVVCEVSIPVGLIHFVHKQSILDIFGLQNWKFISFILCVVSSLVVVFFSGLVSIDNRFSIIIVPIAEEIFFRGYLLSRLKTENISDRKEMTYILLIALLFSFTHIFRSGVNINYLIILTVFGILSGAFYWDLGTIIPGITLHACWNFFVATNIGIDTVEFWFWISIILIPNLIIAIALFKKRVKNIGLPRLW